MTATRITHFARRARAALAAMCLWLSFAVADAGAQISPSVDEGDQEQVTVGVHIASIEDLDFFKGTFKTTFWVWWVYDEEAYAPHEQVEIINAADFKLETVVRRSLPDGSRHLAAKFVATIWQDWDLQHFPFDRQTLRIVIESVGLRAHQLQFYPDQEDSTIGRDLELDGWRILGVNLIPENYQYLSTFGIPSAKPAVYPRITAQIPIERDSITLFFSVYVGYLIAFLITSLLYLVDVLPLQPRINMLMGSIFAAIGNKYVIDTNYPPPSTFSLAEKIGLSTFALIAIAFVVTVLSVKLIAAERAGLAGKLNRLTVSITVPAYLVFVGVAVYLAATST